MPEFTSTSLSDGPAAFTTDGRHSAPAEAISPAIFLFMTLLACNFAERCSEDENCLKATRAALPATRSNFAIDPPQRPHWIVGRHGVPQRPPLIQCMHQRLNSSEN